jgi:hypothetical protein
MQKVQTPRVLNKKQLRGAVPNAVYIGRPSVWGNPFVIGKDGTRAEVVEKCERWLLRQPHLMAQLGMLRGCNLICSAHRCSVMVTCCCDSRMDPGCTANDRSERRRAERSGCVTGHGEATTMARKPLR